MEALLQGITALSWQQAGMIFIGLVLIYLAVAKDYEPALLLPMGFGAILVNIPFSSALDQMVGGQVFHGAVELLFQTGIATELFPLLVFIGVGAMMDFSPVLERPGMALFGLTAQAGIFLTMGLALWMGFDLKEAGAIGIIGAADGPTSIYVSSRFAPHLLGPISVAAYSYMALVPVIQPPVIRLLTTKQERQITMPRVESRSVSKRAKILFPICVTIIVSLLAPASATLIGFLMFGNLLRESGVVDRLARGAENELTNITTILLGLAIAATMTGDKFLRPQTLFIMGMGLVAFVLDTAVGVLSAKLANVFLKNKINPMIGAAGISAFPMASRIVQKMGAQEKPGNFLLMQAAGANVAGQIGSVVAGGLLLAFLS
ncbi:MULTISPECIES: sodium ion-translocating decarboxylase subunit beta [Jonquetella]|uniref:Sodium ion-translocating decarboxylase, beta subunit n=1 Tax=Jonquetella anthropi DSM 22815 TaxID=885272 RepID=H0UJE5_9BACT|nr:MULTISPECIES: sodium ion-translocating decarboxylase subunit beta [Jonquetella]EEX49129.1 sodium ion-translocating decarboxylase, beta subunit [Jonquetella anthropi E3_33 E1]EHM13912.1 sodium ion-translocating decarboxylase, beta subunit [Jonquetella anthropi DSM 22815]ERL24134.1 sodium ion-translocating decarboxylase, beta subunit [Jonquetella sp. BV3C21]